MHRPGSDPNNMEPTDFLCDFCATPWAEDRPMIEGHRGSCLCLRCLSVAYRVLAIDEDGVAPAEGTRCVVCLTEGGKFPLWESPSTGALVCTQCVKRAAGVVHKDPDIPWKKPVGEAAGRGDDED